VLKGQIKDAEMETLLNEDLCKTQEQFAASLGVAQSIISIYLKTMGMIQK